MIELSWLVPILAVLNFFLFFAWHFFSYKKEFSQQYTPLNNRVLAVLVEDFYESVSDWAKENKKRGREVELNELMQSLGTLFAKSRKLSTWNSHISQGSDLLRTVSSGMALTGIFFSCAFIAFAFLAEIELPLALTVAFFIAYVGAIYLMNGVKAWRKICKIESRIEKCHSNLTLGKSLVTEDDEDENLEE